MPITLRPAGLQVAGAFAHLRDWSVYADGQEIGRLREQHAPARPELAWSWSITASGPGRGRVRIEGHAPTLEQAKVDFRTHGRRSRRPGSTRNPGRAKVRCDG
jgi:hypothetical protein